MEGRQVHSGLLLGRGQAVDRRQEAFGVVADIDALHVRQAPHHQRCPGHQNESQADLEDNQRRLTREAGCRRSVPEARAPSLERDGRVCSGRLPGREDSEDESDPARQ